MAEHLAYDSVTVRDSGNSETSGTVRVRDVATVVLGLSVLVFDSAVCTENLTHANAIRVSDTVAISESTTKDGLSPSILIYDSVGITESGQFEFGSPTRVREFIQINLGNPETLDLSRSIVDLCNLTESVVRALEPRKTLVFDSVAIGDDCGQDNPIAVREYVNAVLGDAEFLRLLDEDIAVTESVVPVLHQIILQVAKFDSVAVSEFQAETIENVYSTVDDSVAVTENIQTVLFDEALTTDIQYDDVPVTDSVAKTLTPIYPAAQSDSVAVTDLAVGFLGARQNQFRLVADLIPVTESVVAKYSTLSVLVYDTIGTTDRKNNRSRNRWWRYLWAWRG